MVDIFGSDTVYHRMCNTHLLPQVTTALPLVVGWQLLRA